MRRSVWIGVLVVALHLSLSAAFPAHDGYVTDLAGVLDASTESNLESILTTLERETSAEVAVATVKSLDGMSVEEYANKLFAQWGVGKKQKDNGVLLLIAPAERELRIEVGYGLEGTLPDGLAGDIIRNTITPRFKAGDFNGGVTDGVSRIAAVVRRDPAAMAVADASGTDGPPLLFIIPFLGMFISIGFFAIGLGFRTRTFGSLLFGGMFGGMPWLFLLAIPSWISFGSLAVIAVAMFAFGYRKGHSEFWKAALRDRSKDAYHDENKWDWQMGAGSTGSSSGGSSSDSSSSGGSSFGGGSSGGGGASGSW